MTNKLLAPQPSHASTPTPNLATDESMSSAEPIAFRPGLSAYIAGFTGRFLSHEGHTNYPAPEGYTLRSLLDTYQAADEPPSLSVLPKHPGDIHEDARPLLGLLTASSQLERPLYIPSFDHRERQQVCTVQANHAEWVRLPVRNFVSAPGFEDWNKGRGNSYSHAKIRKYARRATAAPAIDLVSANVQPNGLVLYSLLRDGAHRVAAAHLRGDREISVCSSIYVNRLFENILPLPEPKMSSARAH